MRLLFLIIILAISQQTCHPQQTDVKLIKATSQKWMGGAVGSGYGYNYAITFLAKNHKGLSLDSLWVDGKRVKVDMAVEADKKGLLVSDTVNTVAYESYRNITFNNQKPVQPAESSPPKGYVGAGVLSYYINGKKHYLVISNFEKLPDLNYP